MADIDTDLGCSLVTTILDLCKNLGLDGVAEGIETADQLEAARRHGCRYVQGYLVGKPMPFVDLLQQLRLDAKVDHLRM
jgi:EAL domain-containing protein (putative c-di-GMP-specific phosphodiesterase class I)